MPFFLEKKYFSYIFPEILFRKFFLILIFLDFNILKALPDVLLSMSLIEYTTLFIPDLIILFTHGGV